MINYINFDLEIGTGSNRRYPVVVNSPVGEARATINFPFSEAKLEARLAELEQTVLNSYEDQSCIPTLDEREQVVQTFGQQLFKTVMVGDVRGRYDVCRHEVWQKGMGLRIRLRILAAELAALPWELMFDTSRAEFLCLSQYTPIMRYIELPQPGRPLRVTPPLRILGMVANPRNQDYLDVGREKRRLQKALRELEEAGLVQLTWLEGQTWRDLQKTLRQSPWHIFHFIGHAEFDARRNEGYIALANEDQYTHRLPATDLADLLTNQPALQLVLLNACRGALGNKNKLFSSTAAVLARRGIPAVLGMQYNIKNGTAIEFTRSFYQALADELPLDAGVAEGRMAIKIATPGQLEWATPVLYMRSSDAVLFDLGRLNQEASPSRAQAASATPTKVRPRVGAVSPEDAEAESIWRAAGGHRPGATIVAYGLHSSWVSALAWSPDGTRIVSGGGDKAVHVWDATRGRNLLVYRGHPGEVWDAGWSLDGNYIASVGGGKPAQVWEAETGGKVTTYESHSTLLADLISAAIGEKAFSYIDRSSFFRGVISVTWSPDGQRVASGGADRMLRIWNPMTSETFLNCGPHPSWVYDTAWSPDGRYIASTAAEEVRIWEANTGRHLFTYKGHSEIAQSLAWSPDSTLIASASNDKTVHLWEPTTGHRVLTYRNHTDLVRAVTWSPDGDRIASGSDDKTVQLWNAATGDLFLTYTGHFEKINAVAWSPDGSRIASASSDRTVQVWWAV